MHIVPLHEEFVSYLDLERGYSPLTIKAYQSDFRIFLRYLSHIGQEPQVHIINRQVIRRYIAWLRKEGLKPTSIARRLHSLRSFWNYLRDNDYTERDPFLQVSIPKRARSLPVYLSAQECVALLEATERQSSALLAFRDKAILSVLVFTGIRRAELLELRLTSVDMGQATLRIERGKGGKTRLVPLSHQAVTALKDWLELRPECDHDYLFTSQACGRLGRRALTGALRRALASAGLERKGITPHKLRHTFACLMLQSGCDLFSLSKLLGHTHLDTTTIYLHASVEDLRPPMARHPLNAA